MFQSRSVFEMDGVVYQHADRRPDFTGHTVRTFTYGEEPQVIAQVPLANGGTIEIHGYATHWTQDDVAVAWTDDRGSQHTCWVPATDIRRAADDWHGNYLPR